MLKLYQGRLAVCAIKARLVLAEKGLDWEPVNLNLRAGDQHRPDYLKLNPNGVVPTLIHDDFVQPADPKDRARMRIWMKRVDEYLHPGNVTLTYAMVHAGEMRSKSPQELEAHYRGIPNPITRARQRAAIEQGMDLLSRRQYMDLGALTRASMDAPEAVQALQFYEKAVADMDRQLAQHPWLAGDSYSLADAAVTPYINRFTMLTLANLWAQSRPNVTAWFERIKARPSYATAIASFVTEADLKPYAGLQDWAWSKAQSLLKAA